jgi:hypothetical protein
MKNPEWAKMVHGLSKISYLTFSTVLIVGHFTINLTKNIRSSGSLLDKTHDKECCVLTKKKTT